MKYKIVQSGVLKVFFIEINKWVPYFISPKFEEIIISEREDLIRLEPIFRSTLMDILTLMVTSTPNTFNFFMVNVLSISYCYLKFLIWV